MDAPDFSAVSAVYKGTSPIQRIFRGEMLIWEAGTTYKAGSADEILLILQDAAAMQTEAELASTVSEILAAQDAVGMEAVTLLGSQRVALLLMQSAAAMRMESVRAGTPRDMALGQDALGDASGIGESSSSSGIAFGSPADPERTQAVYGKRSSGIGLGADTGPDASRLIPGSSSEDAALGDDGSGAAAQLLAGAGEDAAALGSAGVAVVSFEWAWRIGRDLYILAADSASQTAEELSIE